MENTPTASASPPTSAESSARQWKYEVFLSFHAADTGRNFTFYLYNELQKREIKTFMDNDETSLDRGEGISQVLLEAIQESRSAIIVLSENYASSSWCLDELTHIIQCKEIRGTVVLPVLYNLDPSELRRQTGAYAHAFAEHEERFKDRTERLLKWRDALLRVSNIFGWQTWGWEYESERQLIKQIVDFICSKPFEIDTRHAMDGTSPRWKYDVFINFRGVDTRNGFLSHLQDELQTANLNIVRDDGPDAIGRDIVPYLLTAIEESKLAIVVLSPQFASSAWCLEELVRISECMGDRKRILPIFYQVDPSHVRQQTGSFGAGFARFEERFKDNKDKVLSWRHVLTMVADLPAFVSSSYEYEGELIREVVKECSRRVQFTELTGDAETRGDVRSMACKSPALSLCLVICRRYLQLESHSELLDKAAYGL